MVFYFNKVGSIKMIKKLMLTTMLLSISIVGVANATTFNARGMGLAGTGVAGGDFSDFSLNPALAAKAKAKVFQHYSFGGGVFVQDEDNFLEEVTLFNKAVRNDNVSALYITGGIGLLEVKKPTYLDVGFHASVGFSLDKVGIAVSVENKTYGASKVNFTTADANAIFASLGGVTGTTGTFPSSLSSTVSYSGVAVTELGLTAGVNLGFLDIGLRTKILQALVYGEKVNVVDAGNIDPFGESEAFFDANIDLGVQAQVSKFFHLGLAITNLIPLSYEFKQTATGSGLTGSVEITPQIAIGGAFKSDLLLFEVNIELLDNWYLGQDLTPTKYLRLATEIGNEDGWGALRLGYVLDMNGSRPSVFSVGVGFKPVRSFGFDIGVLMSPEGSLGASANFNLEF